MASGHDLSSIFGGLSLSPGGLCTGARIALKDCATGGFVRMEPNLKLNTGGKATGGHGSNFPGAWATWIVEEDGPTIKLRNQAHPKYIALKPNGNIQEGGGGGHCKLNFQRQDSGTYLIRSANHPELGLGFLQSGAPAKDAHNVSASPAGHNQFMVIFDKLGNLEHGGKVHLTSTKTGKNVALKPNGDVVAGGGTGTHATFEVFHNATNGRFKFFNENGYLAMQGSDVRKGSGGKWCAFHVKPVGEGNDPLVTIRSAHVDGGNAGLGFNGTHDIRNPANTGMGGHAQFKIVRAG